MDFNDSVISVVAQYDPDYKARIQMSTFQNGTSIFVSGMCFNLLLALEYSLNFRHRAISGNGWLGLLPNRTWTGMSKQIISGEADVSIAQASMIMMQEQLPQIAFLHSTSYGIIVAIFRQPKLHSFRNLLTTSFQNSLWLCIFVSWTALVLVLLLFVHIDKKFICEVNYIDLEFSKDLVLWAIASLCGKGWHTAPSKGCLRSVFAIGQAMASIVFIAYSAVLVSSLANQIVPIKSYTELVSSELTLLGDKWLPFTHRLVEDAYEMRNSPPKPESEDHYMEIEEAIRTETQKSVSHVNFAFLTFADSIANVVHRLNLTDAFFCTNIFTITVTKVPLPSGMFVRQFSPLKESFNRIIILMQERGITHRLNSQYGVQTRIICREVHSAYRGGLEILDIFTAHIFLIVGILLSIIVVIAEKCL